MENKYCFGILLDHFDTYKWNLSNFGNGQKFLKMEKQRVEASPLKLLPCTRVDGISSRVDEFENQLFVQNRLIFTKSEIHQDIGYSVNTFTLNHS